MDTREEQTIINQVLQGDANVFGILVRRYQRPIYNLMYRMCGSLDVAADLAQETFIKAYEHLERFRPGAKFFPWLYAIGLNHARDFLRKRKPSVNCEEESLWSNATCSPHEEQDRLCRHLDNHHLDCALAALPLGYREALVLRYHEDLPIRDVAQALDISLSAAKMRLSRGLEMLRQRLKGGDHEQA
jgi:RNA polymerase sigma-70 factor (ECF subfamily)